MANMKFNQVTITGVTNAGSKVQWMVTDQLGTPRMIVDSSGTLSSMSRHDYLPYGEELFAGTGGRTSGKGYSQADGARQHFTGYERDSETGLDYANARYYANVQGRFTGIDPANGFPDTPQTWNAYTYTLNNPLNLTDPTGMFANAEYGSDPNREMDPFLDYSRKRALWTNEIEHALAVYDDMVRRTVAAALQKKKQKKEQEQQPQQPQVVDVRKDKKITAQVAQIQAKAKPLLPGETPRLTSVRVIVGTNTQVTNGTIIGGYGNSVTNFTGSVRPVAIVPLDQGGNIIDTGNDVFARETIDVVSGKKPDDISDRYAPAPPGGIFYDIHSLPKGDPATVLNQKLFVSQTSPVRTSFMIGTNVITKNPTTGITVTLGPIKKLTRN